MSFALITPFLPEMSAGVQAFVRAAYGVLLLLTLLQAVPEARRFFLSERWRGYAKSSPGVDAIQNPFVLPLVLALWIAVAIALVTGWATPWPALINLVICRYFFIFMRWRGVLRGMGAPGFVSYWLGFVVFLMEYTARFAPALQSLALLVVQVDFALIMLSAGIYKAASGYPRNHGMELGLCNPMWGYWWRQYSTLPPGHWLFWTLNQLGWATEVIAAILMLIPPTREIGGLIISAGFAVVLVQIRLGFLSEMMVLAGLLYVAPGGLLDPWLGSLVPPAAAGGVAAATGPVVAAANMLLGAALWAYLVLLPVAHAGLYFNFYARRSFPSPLQRLLERYTNLFGMIIWRVFSVDLVNFYVQIYQALPAGGDRTLVSRFGTWPRFNHVGEMICLTSLFTTLKYYPSNNAIFQERLLRYARTVPGSANRVIVFEYLSAIQRPTHCDWVVVAEYVVDVRQGTVTERLLDPAFSTRAVHEDSPVHEGQVPGSYAPVRR